MERNNTMKPHLLFLIVSFVFVSQTTAQTIHRTACRGNLDKLDSLLQDTDIQVTDNRGRSLLHWAVACKQKEVVDFLVSRGINVNAEDHDQETPLHIAIRFDNEVFFEMIIGLQTDKTWIDQYGASLMERAVLNKSQPFIQKLVDYGVDINGTNDRGSTPLEMAKRMGAKEVAQWLLSMGADEDKVRSFQMEGDYLGQVAPGLTPRMFAPNFISTEESEFGSVFNARRSEFYYGVDVNGKNEIRFTERVDDGWSSPETILSHERYGYNDPFLSPDEQRLYFISKRAMDGIGELKDHDIWYVERQPKGWSQPINAGPNINSAGNEYYISFTSEGTMYFSSNKHNPEGRDYNVYYSTFVDGQFQEAVSLGDSINTTFYEADVYVSPDESYLIFCSTRPGSLGRGDLYISFRHSDGSWSKSENMGAPINTRHHELCPYVTADGKYLFYTSDQDIYWVDAKIIDEIRERKR